MSEELGWIYPRWHSARRKLLQALAQKGYTGTDLEDTINSFFAAYFFEVGSKISESLTEMRRLEAFPEEAKYVRDARLKSAFNILGQELYKKNLFTKIENEQYFSGHTTTYTVLVFADPDLPRGPGTREPR